MSERFHKRFWNLPTPTPSTRSTGSCEVRPTGQEWRDPCGYPMPCRVHNAVRRVIDDEPCYWCDPVNGPCRIHGAAPDPEGLPSVDVERLVRRHTHDGSRVLIYNMRSPGNGCLLCRALVAAGSLTIDEIGADTRAAFSPVEPTDKGEDQ